MQSVGDDLPNNHTELSGATPPKWRSRLLRAGLYLGIALVAAFIALQVALSVSLTLAWIPETEQEWFNEQTARLKTIKITPEMVAEAREWTEGRYFLSGREGVIPIDKKAGVGVYVVWHSMHDFEPGTFVSRLLLRYWLDREKRYVLDATLAVDQQGNLYRNDGHNCGALVIASDKEVKTLEDFLETRGSGTETITWKPYAPGN
jgi:hypothetical protein